MSDEEPVALPLSFDKDAGSNVEAMDTAVRTPFQSQINSQSVSSRNGVMRGSAHRTNEIEAGVNSSLPTTHIGAPQCTERFDSRNGHTVSNDSDSMNT